MFFGAALGVYPHLNIMDAAFSVRVDGVQYNLRASRHLNMERMDTFVGPIRVEVVEPLKKLRVIVEENEHGVSADLTIEGRHFPLEEPRTIKRNGPKLVQDVTRLTQLGRWSGWIRAAGKEVRINLDTTLGTRDRSWGVRQVGMRDPQAPVTPQEFQVWWFWAPLHFADRVVHFFVNEDGDGRVWNRDFVIQYDNGAKHHLRDAVLTVEFSSGTRFPQSAVVTAHDDKGGAYRIEIAAGPRFFLSGLGYMHPDWTHGLNKGPLAIGYDEIKTAAIVRHEAPYQHVQAFAKAAMITPDGVRHEGTGSFESIVLGRHAPSDLTSMFDVP